MIVPFRRRPASAPAPGGGRARRPARPWRTVLAVTVAALLAALLPPASESPVGAAVPTAARAAAAPGNRIELVFAGDGFTRTQQGRFRAEANRLWHAFTAVEPYRTYRSAFRVRFLRIVSRVPGVSGDPGRGARRATPLGMTYWCRGTERLLCADESRVRAVTGGNGPARHIVAIANSSLYGGAGGRFSTTVGGGGRDAGRVLQHEIGHTLGGLGDEYNGAYAAYSGPLPYPNLARSAPVPWARWLGAADPTGGRVGAFRDPDGLLRPTRNSIMRTLGGTYNLPAREALVEAFYRVLSPIDGTSAAHGRLTVRPLRLAGPRQLRVRWTVDGRRARWADGRTWIPRARLGRGRHRVTATVTDTTPWVRDESFRRAHMTRSVSWRVPG